MGHLLLLRLRLPLLLLLPLPLLLLLLQRPLPVGLALLRGPGAVPHVRLHVAAAAAAVAVAVARGRLRRRVVAHRLGVTLVLLCCAVRHAVLHKALGHLGGGGGRVVGVLPRHWRRLVAPLRRGGGDGWGGGFGRLGMAVGARQLAALARGGGRCEVWVPVGLAVHAACQMVVSMRCSGWLGGGAG